MEFLPVAQSCISFSSGSYIDNHGNGALQVLHVRCDVGGRYEHRFGAPFQMQDCAYSAQEAQRSLDIAEQLGDKFLTAKAQNLTGLALSSQRSGHLGVYCSYCMLLYAIVMYWQPQNLTLGVA